MLPTLSANATERITNASGFTGQASSYTLQALLSWNIDYNKYASSRAQSESLRVEEIRTEQTQRRVQDAIFNAYHEVEASIAKSESARAAADATRKAAELALERYQAGALTQLEVVQSQRDAFGAQAERVKADADLALSRVTLRLAAGKSVDVPASRLPPISVDELQPPELSSSDSGDSSPQAAPGSDTTAPQ
jgi:outer membrane protein TolC